VVLLVLLVAIAIALPIALAAWRLARVRRGKEPQPEGWSMRLLVLVALLAPPIVLQFVLPASDKTQLDGITSVIVYVGLLLLLWLVMWIAARLVARFAPASWRSTALLALAGEATLGDVPFDPPMTEAMSDGVTLVDTRNEAFPRGRGFIEQVDRPGFRAAWDALDAATRALEGLIAEAMRLRTGVAQRATETAADARGRLDTLRRAATAEGQAWPG
jgi:hypothetical protein